MITLVMIAYETITIIMIYDGDDNVGKGLASVSIYLLTLERIDSIIYLHQLNEALKMNKLLIALVTVISLVGCGKKEEAKTETTTTTTTTTTASVPANTATATANTATATASPAK